MLKGLSVIFHVIALAGAAALAWDLVLLLWRLRRSEIAGRKSGHPIRQVPRSLISGLIAITAACAGFVLSGIAPLVYLAYGLDVGSLVFPRLSVADQVPLMLLSAAVQALVGAAGIAAVARGIREVWVPPEVVIIARPMHDSAPYREPNGKRDLDETHDEAQGPRPKGPPRYT